ncbi:DUF402 domain-containing protein [Prescottella defluvii]|uniref:DUF7700 domain-containing protein n=1 Tax=Prescottella defluvii TaxID=1323361 RepID=UPI0004F2C81E|nr:hypothetical protein [Prescottella defluvii]
MNETASGIEAYQLGRSFEVMPIPMDPEFCQEIPAGPVTFVVESRRLSDEAINTNALDRGRPDQTYDTGIDDGGACVHVCGSADGREWLRFDCFDNEPHYHYVRHNEQRNVVVRFDQFAEGDPEAWTLDRLRTRLPAMLRHAGAEELADVVAGAELGGAVDEVAEVLRRLR